MDRDDKIIKLYSENKSVRTIGEAVGISHERVRQILDEKGVPLRRPGPISSALPRPKKRTPYERLLETVITIKDAVLGDHWIWPHKVQKGRYGKFIIQGRIVYAHRAVFYFKFNRLPKGRLRKVCKVHNCVSHWRENDPSNPLSS